MGSSKRTDTTINTKTQTMKVAPILSLLAQTSLASSIFENRKDASKFLRIKRSNRFSDFKIPEFNNVESWERLKDNIKERSSIPAEELAGLEKCAKKCIKKDWKLDLIGKAYEEKMEVWDEDALATETSRPWPCQHCCHKLPKTVFGKLTKREIKIPLEEYKKVARMCRPQLYRELKSEEVRSRQNTRTHHYTPLRSVRPPNNLRRAPVRCTSGLPAGWIAKPDRNGRIYYENVRRGITQWGHPISGKKCKK